MFDMFVRLVLQLKEENAVLKQKINLVDGTSSQSTSNNESLFPVKSDSVQQVSSHQQVFSLC